MKPINWSSHTEDSPLYNLIKEQTKMDQTKANWFYGVADWKIKDLKGITHPIGLLGDRYRDLLWDLKANGDAERYSCNGWIRCGANRDGAADDVFRLRADWVRPEAKKEETLREGWVRVQLELIRTNLQTLEDNIQAYLNIDDKRLDREG